MTTFRLEHAWREPFAKKIGDRLARYHQTCEEKLGFFAREAEWQEGETSHPGNALT